MKFTTEIINESLTAFLDYLTDPNKYQSYTFEVPDGFNPVPVFEQVKTHSELIIAQDKMVVGEKITRIMIDKKNVKVFLDEKEIGSFILNGNAAWDSLSIFRKHPFALNSLIEICLGDMVGKYMPPLKNTEQAAAV